jgi:hypothetical protein
MYELVIFICLYIFNNTPSDVDVMELKECSAGRMNSIMWEEMGTKKSQPMPAEHAVRLRNLKGIGEPKRNDDAGELHHAPQ